MTFTVVIPARYQSTRLPGKPLADVAGKPLIQHTFERARESGAAEVIIATDDERIRNAAVGFGATVVMTSEEHRSGTERIAEVAIDFADDTVVVNVQADEPLLPGRLVQQVADDLIAHNDADVSTLCEEIDTADAVFDAAVVKVVLSHAGYALYFSRAPIPWYRDSFAPNRNVLPAGAQIYRHIGLYAYRAAYLRRYVQLAESPLEVAECLEQLRVLYHGGRIHVAVAAEPPGVGVDTPEDLERARHLLNV